MVRELQPGILINDRLDIPGDFVTPEQYQPSGPMTRDGKPVVWEACQTLNGSWGYDRDNLDWKSPDLLVRMLVDSVSKDGNLLLNVGPTGRGEFDPRALETLAETRPRGRGCTAGRSTAPVRANSSRQPDCRFTQRGDRLYLHVFAWPLHHLHLPGHGREGRATRNSCTTPPKYAVLSLTPTRPPRTPPWADSHQARSRWSSRPSVPTYWFL